MSNWLGYSERSIEKMINNHSDFPEPVISGPDLEDARWFAHEVLTWIQQPSSKPLKIR
jgi:predicted DNA-binding transcriptional regulator AlpA